MANRKELQALITLAGKVDPSLQKALKTASNQSDNLSKRMSNVGTIAKGVFAGTMISKGVSWLASNIKNLGSQGIELASDLYEVQNVVNTTFGSSSYQINAWSKQALNAFGLSELQAKQFNGTMGAMLKSSGIAGKSLTTMSENLSGLSGDFASFYNISQEDAFEKIQAGISGETKPLRELGINMTVANLQAYALSKGIKTSYDKMSQASQVALRYSYLMDKSKDAQGDFAKTLNTSYANQKRLLQTKFQEKLAQLASSILPYITQYMSKANTLLTNIDIPSIVDKASGAFKHASDVIEDIYTGAKKTYDFINNNWNLIAPIIAGIAVATLGWEIQMVLLSKESKAALIIQTLTKAWEYATTVLALMREGISLTSIASSELSLAWKTNPVGLVITALSILVTICIAVYKNWDRITASVKNAWAWFTNLISKTPDWALALFAPLAPILLLIKHFKEVKEAVTDAYNAVKKFFGFGDNSKSNNSKLTPSQKILSSRLGITHFATGGFANQPSIFGEAGLEAAIPIRYKSPRSLSLLNQTAKAIGADSSGSGSQYIFNFSPTINGGDEDKISSLLANEYIKFKAMMEQFLEEKARESYA